MVDGQGQDLAAPSTGPVRGDVQKSDGIAPSRQGQRDGRRVIGCQPVVEAAVYRLDPSGRQPHSAWTPIWPARVRTGGAAVAA